MNSQRFGLLASVALTGSLALAGSGSDNTSGNGASQSSSSSASAAAPTCFTGTLNAEGSSAQKNAIEEAISSYGSACSGAKINYNPSGSGAGIKQFLNGQVNFAGSDSALKTTSADGGDSEAKKAEAFCGSPAWNLPMVTGPIAVSFNVKGITKLVLTPAVIGDLFSGKITTWNDPAIAALNAGVTLPSTPVKVFFRSDESGTTENFTKYLKAAAPEKWTAEPAKKWTGAGEGKEKSSGVSEGVKSTDGGLTYVEWSYARDNKLGIAQIDNGSGPVELTGAAVGKAVAAAKQSGTGNDLALKLDYATKEKGAYPILLVTYEIVCSKGKDAATQTNIKNFLTHFASPQVQKSLEEIGYAPLPSEVATKVTAAIAAVS